MISVDSFRVSGILGYLQSKEAVQEAPGAPWWVVPPSGHPSGTSSAHLMSSGPEKIHKKFRYIWTLFGIDFLPCKKQAENSNWHWALCQ